jgi:hypothetical protein
MVATLSSVNHHHDGMSLLKIRNINILHKHFRAQHVMYVI